MREHSGIGDDLLRKLAEASGPCITIVLPQAQLRGSPARRDRTFKRVRKAVRELKLDPEPLLASIEETAPEAKSGSLLVFQSPNLLEWVSTASQVPEKIAVADRFEIRPWLPLKDWDREFYILAISLKHPRLLRCTGLAAEEVELPAETPDSLSDAMQTRPPDHSLDNMSTGGPSTGSMKGVRFGTSTLAEVKDEYVLHFFLQLDRGVRAVLKQSEAPLVLAGVEHELALYRRINTYAHVVEPGVSGSPERLGPELHKRALGVIRGQLPEPLQKDLDGFDKLVGTGHASTRVQEIVKAAHDGRISHLLLRPDAEYEGKFDEVRRKVKRQPGLIDPLHDLLNDAAAETFRHGGTVSAVPADKMPNGAPVAAIYRYAVPEPASQALAARRL